MKKTNSFDHYSMKLTESKKYIWYVSSRGYVYKFLKSAQKSDHDFSKPILVNGYMKDGFRSIKVRNKKKRLSHLIGSLFLKDYYPGCVIGFKDNDPNNLNVPNLFVYSYKEHGLKTGYKAKSMPVVIEKNNKRVTHRSVRSAAKTLNVSYQTLSDYLNGTVVHSVIDDLNVNVFYRGNKT